MDLLAGGVFPALQREQLQDRTRSSTRGGWLFRFAVGVSHAGWPRLHAAHGTWTRAGKKGRWQEIVGPAAAGTGARWRGAHGTSPGETAAARPSAIPRASTGGGAGAVLSFELGYTDGFNRTADMAGIGRASLRKRKQLSRQRATSKNKLQVRTPSASHEAAPATKPNG